MTPDRWRELSRIYGAVMARPAAERSAAVERLCGQDVDLRREVESLILSDAGAAPLDRAALDHASGLDASPPLAIGSMLGTFRIDARIGVGGMGEVYRARDTRLNRDVAIKVLPPAFASDPERLARFKREPQMLAALNHPNIAAIYGLEEQHGGLALVLELVEGPTLADRIARGPLPLDEALAIARQIADALEAAHEQGIIHRDLKPANIKVRDDGTVKVLDFGLAKIAEPPQGGSSVATTNSPTITTPAMTAAGMLLGTAAYMSPEQAKGRPVDKRSDIWAFGCVLYEMLTGQRPFTGGDVAETLAAILKSEPDWTALPADTPASVRRLLRRALLKDQRRRTGDMASMRADIDDASEPTVVAQVARRAGARWFVVGLAGLLAAVGLVVWLGMPGSTKPAAAESRLDIATPDTGEPASVVISPDGSKIVYVLDAGGRSEIVMRGLGSGDVRSLPGTIGGRLPFWAPNSRSIAFFADGDLKRLDLVGGPPRTLAPAPGGRGGGSWSVDDTILFMPAGSTKMPKRVSANGGPAATVPLDLGDQAFRARGVWWMPDGQHFLFYAIGTASRGVYIAAQDGTSPRFLASADTSAVVANGHLLFGGGSTLFAQRFDPVRLELSGDAFAVADPVNSAINGVASVSVSRDGTIAFRRGAPGDRRQLMWLSRTGEPLAALGELDADGLLSPNLSHDGRRVAVGKTVNRVGEIWTLDASRSAWTRITTGVQSSQPVWSPDDSRFAFISTRDVSADIHLRPSRPGGVSEALVESPPLKGTTDWSRDGRYLLFTSGATRDDATQGIWVYDFSERRASPLLRTDGTNYNNGKFSPDGRWIGYDSDLSGRFEVYVQRFDRTSMPIKVSESGGAQVRWRQDGRELFYLDLKGQIVAVAIDLAAAGQPGVDTAQPLFRVRVPNGTLQPGGAHHQYDVSADGTRFLVNTLVPDPSPPPITLILNWHPVAASSR